MRSSLRPGQWSSELRPERIERCRKARNERGRRSLAAARGKQTGVGVKVAAKKKETHEDTKEKSGEIPRGNVRCTEARRGYETRGEGEAREGRERRERTGIENDCQDGRGFFSFRREPGSPHFG